MEEVLASLAFLGATQTNKRDIEGASEASGEHTRNTIENEVVINVFAFEQKRENVQDIREKKKQSVAVPSHPHPHIKKLLLSSIKSLKNTQPFSIK